MLTKLTPEQISKFWDVVKYAVEESLPPMVSDHPDKMNRILTSCLSGKTDVWASYIRDGKSTKFEGIVLTRFLYDDASNTKNLLIYCLYGYTDIQNNSWLSGIESLSKYAKANRCSRVIAYTNSPYIVKIVRELGGDASYTFLSFDLDKIIK